jgi:hypothetical protein
MKDFVKSCDYLGFRPSLHVNGEKVFKTFFTGTMSILMVSLSIAFTLYFGSELILKTSSNVIKTSEQITSFGPYKLSNDSYNVMIGMQDKYFRHFVDPSVFYVSGSMTIMKNIIFDKTGEVKPLLLSYPVNVDLCSKFYKDSEIVEKDRVLSLDKYYCPEPNKSKMEGYRSSELSQFFQIKFNKCVNNTKNNNHCKSPDEIDKAIQGAYVVYKLTSYRVNQRDFSQPIQRFLSHNYNLLNAKLSLEYSVEYMPLIIHSNDGLVINNDNIYEALDYEEKIFYKLNDVNDSFVTFSFRGSDFSTVYYRNYVKIQSIIVQIGGFLQVITIFANLISNLFSENFYFFYFLGNLYPKFKIRTIQYKEIHIPMSQPPSSHNELELDLSPDVKNSKDLINDNNKRYYTKSKNNNEDCKKNRDSLNVQKDEKFPKKAQNNFRIYVDSPKKMQSRLFEFLCTKFCICRKVDYIGTKINKGLLAFYRHNTSINRLMGTSYRLEVFAQKLKLKEEDLDYNFPFWLEEKINKDIQIDN